MTYHYLRGVRLDKKRRWLWIPVVGLFLLAGLMGGAYSFLIVSSPLLADAPFVGDPNPEATKQQILQQKPGALGDRLFLPQINVSIPIKTGEASSLKSGAWLRKITDEPVKGGNMVISALRFDMGVTPQETRQRSPFYRLDMLEVADQIYVDYQGKRYAYAVVKEFTPQMLETLEGDSDKPKLTLFSWEDMGKTLGPNALEAKFLGVVKNGKIELNPDAE